jgi:acyl-[acyl-carrier-protein] desaturase
MVFDIGTGRDPKFRLYKFSGACDICSHNRVAQMAKKYGDNKLSKMCKMIAGDEMRHHHAYSEFVSAIFKVDPSENDDRFSIHDETKIVMPAHFLRESGEK